MYVLMTGKHPIYQEGDNINDYLRKLSTMKFTFPTGISKYDFES